MKCKQIKGKFPDYLIGEIDKITRKDIQDHVTACDSCREELESLSAIWTKLGVLPEEQPSDNVRARFYTTLEEYKRSIQLEKSRPKLGTLMDGWFERLMPKRPAFQFSAALILLIVGITAGYFLRSGMQQSGEIAQLRQEVRQIRQITAASLLRQESLKQQLSQAGLGSQVRMPDEETLTKFLRSVESGATGDSRLVVAINALLRQSPATREELAQSLSNQTSPLVEIALAFSQHVTKF